MGVDKAKEYAQKADLIIYVVDASKKLDENDEKIMRLIYDKKAIILLNKSAWRRWLMKTSSVKKFLI